MKERPILFSGPMVRAILEGRKTMTRRVVKPQPSKSCNVDSETACEILAKGCPYGDPGDKLWVRETFCETANVRGDGHYLCRYRAGDEYDKIVECAGPWKPSIFMPRWASRITLEITSVRVERLQKINAVDAIAEGIEPTREQPGHFNWKWYGLNNAQCNAVMSFEMLWIMINGPESWDANPWVWVIKFRRVTP